MHTQMAALDLGEDEEFLADPDSYFDRDRMLSVRDAATADAYVAPLRHASVQQLEAIIKALYQVTEARLTAERRERPLQQAPPPPPKMKGGSELHPQFYRFMCFCDTVHDFADGFKGSQEERAKEKAEKIAELHAVLDVELPREVTLSDMANENVLVRMLTTSRRTLTFSTGAIPNPLFGANILDRFDLVDASKAHPEATLEQLYEMQHHSVVGKIAAHCKIIPVDVLCAADTRNTNLAILNLFHVAQLIGVMRTRVGTDAYFQVDASDDQLVLLVCSLEHISAAFLRKFVFAPTFAPTSAPTFAPTTLDQVRERLKQHMRGNNIEIRWVTTLSDANIFDAAEKSSTLLIDPRPTGPIFKGHVSYQIELYGVHLDKTRQRFVNATLTDSDGLSHPKVIPANEAMLTFSTNSIKLLVKLQNVTNPKTLQEYVVNCTKPFKYALKRAGDWGQVEHAAKYGKVFVTSDKLAALYAWCRGVRFVYLRRQEKLAGYASAPLFHRYTWGISGRWCPPSGH